MANHVLRVARAKVKKPDGSYSLDIAGVAEQPLSEQITQIQNVGSAQVTAIQQKGAETLASIPTDYLDLVKSVSDLTDDLASLDVQVHNLEAAAEGHLYNLNVVTDKSYSTTVPTNALPYASLEMFGGHNEVVNGVMQTSDITQVLSTSKNLANPEKATAVTTPAANSIWDGTTLTNTEVDTLGHVNLFLWYVHPDSGSVTGFSSQSVSEVGTQVIRNSTVLPVGTRLIRIGHKGNVNNFRVEFQIPPLQDATRISVTCDVDGIDVSTVGGFKLTNISIELGDTDIKYVPYFQIAHPIPNAIRNLSGYGWGVSDVYNEVNFDQKQYIQRIGAVDLGTLRWTFISGQYSRFMATVPNIKQAKAQNVKGNIICSEYTTDSVQNMYLHTTDNTIGVNNRDTMIWLYASDLLDVPVRELPNYLSGVMLYYEMDEPIIVDISNLAPEDFYLKVDGARNVTFQQLDNTELAVPNKIVYLTKIM